MGAYLELAERAIATRPASREPPIQLTPSGSPGSLSVAPGGVIVLQPGHRLAHFDWDGHGFNPGTPPQVIHGITHKRVDCRSRRSWRHVWGMVLCADCWPCTDPLAESPVEAKRG